MSTTASKKKGKAEASGKKKKGTAPRVSRKLSISLEDLDEKSLKQKLDSLDIELHQCRINVENYKKENDWFRSEIESTQRDTAEYIGYLEGKKAEKQNAIIVMTEANQRQYELYLEKRKAVEAQYNAKGEVLRAAITDLEVKLEGKNQDIMALSDLVSRRTRHEADVAKLKNELVAMTKEHVEKVSEVERTLLESQMRLQKEADAKVQAMESAAHQQASKYLAEHTAKLSSENQRLEQELRQAVLTTREQLARKETLERENRELTRERKLREDIVRIRVERVMEAHRKQQMAKKKKKTAKRTEKVGGNRQPLHGAGRNDEWEEIESDSDTEDDEFLC